MIRRTNNHKPSGIARTSGHSFIASACGPPQAAPPVDGLEHNRSTAAQNLYERYTMCDPLESMCGAFRRECTQKTPNTIILDKIQYESQTLPVLPVIFCTTLEF